MLSRAGRALNYSAVDVLRQATALTVMLIHTLDRTTYTPEDLVEREIEMKKQQRVAHAEAVKEVAGLSDADLKVGCCSIFFFFFADGRISVVRPRRVHHLHTPASQGKTCGGRGDQQRSG